MQNVKMSLEAFYHICEVLDTILNNSFEIVVSWLIRLIFMMKLIGDYILATLAGIPKYCAY